MRLGILPVGLALLACSPTLPPPTLAPAPDTARDTDQNHLLLFPEANAESLLGRAVMRSADGVWTIAEARAPGCEVQVTHEKAQYHSSRKVDAHSMTSLAGGYAKVLSLELKCGRQNTASVDIDNSEILRADTRGGCGDLVVDTVFVGHGKRSIAASAEAGGGASVQAGLVSASPSVDTGQSQTDAIEWKDDQAYGFTVRQDAKTEPLNLRVGLPSIIDEGTNVTAQFQADSEAWIIVYYVDATGHGDVLWPSNEEPAPHVAPGAPAILPSDNERSQGLHIKAGLLKPGQPSREMLVIYAFADKRDFDALKPNAGSDSTDGLAYAAELTKKLGDIPISRWSRAQVSYVIQPKRN